LAELGTQDDLVGQFTEEVFTPNLSGLNSTLQSIEAEQKEKISPRSIQKPWSERRPSTLLSFQDKERPLDLIAKDQLFDTFPGDEGLRPCALDKVIGAVKRPTSAGLPTLERKGVLIDEGRVDFSDHPWPAVLYTRTQEGEKTRDIWGYPLNLLIKEGRYFLPLFNRLKKHPLLSALRGPDQVDLALTELIERRKPNEKIICEDFSTFDQSIIPDLSRAGFETVSRFFSSFDFDISDTFINIGLVTPDGVLQGPHGVPSGSWFTNIIDSIVHCYAICLQRSQLFNDKAPLKGWKSQVQGDDGVCVLDSSVGMRELEDLYSTIGLKFNSEKTFSFESEAVYLQRYYSTDYVTNGIIRGIYPVYRALGRLLYLERWNNISKLKGGDYFSIRAISILENCKWHPMFRSFVEWVVKRDKYDLKFSRSGLKEYINKFSSKTVTTIKNQYSDDIKGIDSFETVKILKSL
jgi:hypothetical protein